MGRVVRILMLVFHVFITLALIGVILLQRGEDVSAGSGSSGGQMFSARGGKNLLTRITSILATLFFAGCIFLAILVRNESRLLVKEPEPTVLQGEGSKSTAPLKPPATPNVLPPKS